MIKAFVVMPDHVHGLLIFNKTAADLNTPWKKNEFGPQSRNLASVIRWFKVGVTIRSKKENPDFAWQGRYHESIIRSPRHFIYVHSYINYNPYKLLVKHLENSQAGQMKQKTKPGKS